MSAALKLEAVAVLGVLGVAGIAAFWLLRRGAAGVGADVVNAAGQVTSGAVGAIGSTVGLPTPSQTVTDPAEARYLIDTAGYGFASRWSSLPALAQGALLPSGSGRAPRSGTSASAALIAQAPQLTTGDFARLDRTNYETAGRNATNGQPDLGTVTDGAYTGSYDALGNYIGP